MKKDPVSQYNEKPSQNNDLVSQNDLVTQSNEKLSQNNILLVSRYFEIYYFQILRHNF